MTRMSNKAFPGLFLAAALVAQVALAGPSRVELNDGSVLTGELVGYANGRYTLRSPTLGDISLEESKVRSVRPGAAGGAGGMDPGGGPSGIQVPLDLAGQLQATQQRLAADPEVLGMIMALQSDPEIRAVLTDPAFLALITSGNLQAIQGDPRFQELLQHPGLRAILERAR
jgi:hypothetical protein